MTEKLGPDHYRYFATLDEAGVHVKCERFVVIGETPLCWYVIRANLGHYAGTDWSTASPWRKKLRKRVLKASSGRRYCYPDKRKAMASFAARQRWRINHAKRSMSIAELSLKAIDLIPELAKLPDEVSPLRCGHDDFTASIRWEG